MRIKHLCILIHIRTMAGLVSLNMFNSSSAFCSADRSKAVLLLLILFVIYVSCISLLCCLVCSLLPYDHLLGMG